MQNTDAMTSQPLSMRRRLVTALANYGAIRCIIMGFIALAFIPFILLFSRAGEGSVAAFLMARQDRTLLIMAAVILAIASLRLPAKSAPLSMSNRTMWIVAALVTALCYAGHLWILEGYNLSRDEQMAVFDTAIFASGQLVQPLPVFWQSHTQALNNMFMLSIGDPIAWVSAYLPMNAAIRALVGTVADPALTSPLMTGLGLIFLIKCAGKLWPGEREPAIVAAILYVVSGQVIFAGMTSFSMSSHLTLNLLWLWLFLMNRRWADMLALLFAFVATGLHQPLFHPLFAFPFLCLTLRDRERTRVALYLVGYALICAFWLAWPLYIQSLITGPLSQVPTHGTDYFTRLTEQLFEGGKGRFPTMTANLLRFAAWQPMLLLPLIAAALLLGHRQRWTLVMAVCVALPVLIMFIILPIQGHGYGYRYLHPVLGVAFLLAAQGWRMVIAKEPEMRPLLLRTALMGFVLVMPVQAIMAYNYDRPFVAAKARIEQSGADYVMIDELGAPFSFDLVINAPDLSNRPVRLLTNYVEDALLKNICVQGARVAIMDNAAYRDLNANYGVEDDMKVEQRVHEMTQRLSAAGCQPSRLR